MNALVMLVALLIERFFDLSPMRSLKWYDYYERWCFSRFSGLSPYFLMALLVFPLIVAVLLASYILSHFFYGFLNFVFYLCVMLYCFGPRNWWADMTLCLDALSSGKPSQGISKLRTLLEPRIINAAPLPERWLTAILVSINRRIFSCIIWFGLLGLWGVVAYRLMSHLAELQVGKNDKSHAISALLAKWACHIEAYLEWPSVRVLTFIFALTGHFTIVFPLWRRQCATHANHNDALLTECAEAALKEDDKPFRLETSLSQTVHLLDRSLVVFFIAATIWIFLVPY